MGLSYSDAGVDIEKGDRFADFIRRFPSSAISKGIGGFAGGIELDMSRYRHPVMLSCTDGVGTKLIIAEKLQKFDTIGIDLVAMSVNDLIVCGAAPQVFLDYIACGRIHEEMLKEVVTGIIHGCEQADCLLAGGETAEMPDIYDSEKFDLAGFCVGLVEKEDMLPKKTRIKPGDLIWGIPSSGLHSNGFSLARKVLPLNDRGVLAEMLTPTRIYVKELKPLLETKKIKAAAHITGGGLESNTCRSLPPEMTARLSWNWAVPELMQYMTAKNLVTEAEMRRVFNMGIGITLISAPEDADLLLQTAALSGTGLLNLGEVVLG